MGFNATAFDSFYKSALGQLTQRFVSDQLYELWPHAKGFKMLGVGYPHPYMDNYREESERCIILLPPSKERIIWPDPIQKKNMLGIAQTTIQPFPAETFDRVLMVHCLEFQGRLPEALSECRRVLKANGRMIMVVPNRLSSWARQETTPFGYGAPFTYGQINRYLIEAGLEFVQVRRALFAPPFETEFCRKMAPMFEGIGQAAFKSFCGVFLLEVIKTTPATASPTKGTPAVNTSMIKPAIKPQPV